MSSSDKLSFIIKHAIIKQHILTYIEEPTKERQIATKKSIR